MIGDEPGVVVAGGERRLVHQPAVEAEIGLQTPDQRLVQRPAQTGDRRGTVEDHRV